MIVYFAGRVFAARALNPVSNIITEVNNISIANLYERISEGNEKDELAMLAKTFNSMLSRLETAFKTQKNFISNASHELRTPLTVITGQLEVVLLKARTNNEYLNAIESVLSNIKNLNHLSNRLLLLAQSSLYISDESLTPIRIDDTIWNARSEILKRYKDYSINITFSDKVPDASMLVVLGNELLLKTSILNLMDNACKYSQNNTSDVLIDVEGSNLLLHFIDKGIGIPPDDIKMIFEPFYRAKNSMGVKGHGIGLSLVENIIKQHNGEIQVRSQVDKGSEFLVTIPAYHPKT